MAKKLLEKKGEGLQAAIAKKKKARAMASGYPVYCKYDALVDPEKLVPNPNNPNKHPERQIELLSRIIRGQGWRAAITVSNRSGYIVRGHGRLQAAKILNVTQVPVEYQDYANEAEEHADMIADNKLAELAEIDKKMLKVLVADIKAADFDVSLTGIDSEELMKLLADNEGVPSPVPETPKKAISKKGDVWELGKHRLMCGDSTNPEDVKKLMDGKKAVMLFTDPPYGVNYESKKTGKIKNDNLKTNNLKTNNLINELLLPALKLGFQSTKDDAPFFVWYANSTRDEYAFAIKAAGLEEKQQILWDKPTFALGRSDYHYKHEPCFYCQKIGHKARYFGDRAQSTVWQIQAGGQDKGTFAIANGIRISRESGNEIYIKKEPPKSVKSRIVRLKEGEKLSLSYDDSNADVWHVSMDNKLTYIHPTQKPAELAMIAIGNHTKCGEIILDLFSGSGSTIMAAEKTERIGYAMELDERFVDAAVQRYADYCAATKQKPSIKRNGKDAGDTFIRKPAQDKNTGKGKANAV